MDAHSAMSHIVPQVIDGFKIEIDSDVVYPEYMNETKYTSSDENSLMDKFVVDLNQSLIPSNYDSIPLFSGEQRNISEYASSYDLSNSRPALCSGLGPSHYLHHVSAQRSHGKKSQSEMIHHAHEGSAKSKPPNSFLTRCTNSMSPEATVLDDSIFHHSAEYSWIIQNAPLDLSIPRGLNSNLKLCKTEADEPPKKGNIASDPRYQMGNLCIDDRSGGNTNAAHVVHRPIATYPTLFHSHTANRTGDFSNCTSSAAPNNSWHDKTWSRNLSRDPNLTVQWGCCDKYLWRDSFKDVEMNAADLIDSPINHSLPFYSNSYSHLYGSNSSLTPSSGLAKTIGPDDLLTCGLANSNPLPLNRVYHEMGPSVLFQPDNPVIADSRRQNFLFDATRMSSDMSCRQIVNSHRAAHVPTGLKSAIINLDSEFMYSDHVPFTGQKYKQPVSRAVTVSSDGRFFNTHENVTQDILTSESNRSYQRREGQQLTPFKSTKNSIMNEIGKDCGNFIILPPINKTIYRNDLTPVNNYGETLASMPFERKRKRAMRTAQVLDEIKQHREETFNDKRLPKLKESYQTLEGSLNDKGLIKLKRGNHRTEGTFSDKGLLKSKRCNQPMEGISDYNGLPKLKRGSKPTKETFNDKGLPKLKSGNQPMEETFNDKGFPKLIRGSQPSEVTFNENDIPKPKRDNQPTEETFNDKGLLKPKRDSQHLNTCSVLEGRKMETIHPGSNCQNDLSNKTPQRRKEDLADSSEKLVASFVCVTCKLQCDSLFSLLEHQQKECQFVRKVYHATDCLGKVKDQDCQCTNCSLCKGIFNSKFRVFSHCLKGCYMTQSFCASSDNLQKLHIGTSPGHNKDGNGSDESSTKKKKQKLSEDEISHSMEMLRAKGDLLKGLEIQDKPDINKLLDESADRCVGNKTQELSNCDTFSKILPRLLSTDTQTCDNHLVKLRCEEITNLSTVDNAKQLNTGNFDNMNANKEVEMAFNLKDSSHSIKTETCPMGDAHVDKPVLDTSEQGKEQTNIDVLNSTAHGHFLGVSQKSTERCKTPENRLDNKSGLPEMKVEVEDCHVATSVNYYHRNDLKHTENRIKLDTLGIQGSDEQHTTETTSPSVDTFALPTSVIKTEPPSQCVVSVCGSQDRSTQSSPAHLQKLQSKAYNHGVSAVKGWSERRGDLEFFKGAVQEGPSELQAAVKESRRVRRSQIDVAGIAKDKRIEAGMDNGSPKMPSAIAFGASQRINKNGEKEKITYLLDANSKPIMLVEKELKENSIMKCEKCLQCFPTFLFLTWHAKYTCPFSVPPRRGRPRSRGRPAKD